MSLHKVAFVKYDSTIKNRYKLELLIITTALFFKSFKFIEWRHREPKYMGNTEQ